MENIIIRPAIAKVFEKFIKSGRVLFISAPCGFGKTVLADALLRRMQVCRLEAGAAARRKPSRNACVSCRKACKRGGIP